MKIERRSSQTLLFGVTIFVSAILLFSMQPMVAKMLLPLLGGTPAVWNTCMVFFQAVLLGGYAYALLISRWPLQRQILAQVVVLLLAIVSLPIGLSSYWISSVPATDNPSVWLLGCLAATVGLPFFIVSSNSPLLQKWYSRTSAVSAQDPYFLYSASNAGSLLALLAYPALLEPFFSLQSQSRLWTILYAVLVLLIIICAVVLRRSSGVKPSEEFQPEISQAQPTNDQGEELRMRRRLRWLMLAFAPSSLMLGVTNYITTDIASVPLLWIIPLALYLLTMVLAFARRQLFSSRLPTLVVPGATVVFLIIYLADTSGGGGARTLILLHLVYFFFAALMCHHQLASDRPSAQHLAEFYVWLSLGGVLGGVFNALIAPLIFRSVIEYPLVILMGCLLLPATREITNKVKETRLDFVMPAFIFALTFGLGWAVDHIVPGKLIGLLFVLAVPMFLSYPLRRRPLRFALSLGAVMLGSGFISETPGTKTLHTERNFFGVVKVTHDKTSDLHWFSHGSTIHGRQNISPEHRCEPLSYYHQDGPLGRVFAQFAGRLENANVAIVGLGAGATVAYARPQEKWTFYEINPAVVSIARTPEYFTYLSNCAQVTPEIVLGDARLKLRGAPESSYDLIVLDAFSSDSIPLHLLTQQALDLYLSKLAPSGLLVFHISNRNLDLTSVVADLANSRNLAGFSLFDMQASQPNGKDPSHWVVMARDATYLSAIANDSNAKALEASDSQRVWTDDFSNIISVFKWR